MLLFFIYGLLYYPNIILPAKYRFILIQANPSRSSRLYPTLMSLFPYYLGYLIRSMFPTQLCEISPHPDYYCVIFILSSLSDKHPQLLALPVLIFCWIPPSLFYNYPIFSPCQLWVQNTLIRAYKTTLFALIKHI